MQLVQFKIDGMTCAGCAKSVIAALQGCVGVRGATVNHVNGLAEVDFDETLTNVENLRAAVEDAGFDVVG